MRVRDCFHWPAARRVAAVAAMLLAMMGLGVSSAPAHAPRNGGEPVRGIAIPNLTHGQMAVMARWSGTLAALAARQATTDERFRRVANFAAIQRTFCLWGLVPGSVSDEASPFNECMHATLAAERALLVEMLRLSPRSGAVREAADGIEREMIANGASLVLCRFSAEGFDTGSVVRPRWGSVRTARPVAGALALGCLLLAGFELRRRRRGVTGKANACPVTDAPGAPC